MSDGFGILENSCMSYDYILYRHEFEEMHKCPRCGVSRYKLKDDEE